MPITRRIVDPYCARWLTLGVVILYSVACGPGDQNSSSGARPPGTPAEIEDAPLVRVGVVEGDAAQEFDRVVTPFLMPDGRLVVPLNGAGSIRIFDADGQLLSSLGRPGAGPGEFRYLNSAWPRGDTIEAFDSRLRRVTRFFPDGSVEVVQLQTDLPDLSVAPGPVPDGWIVGGVSAVGAGGRDDIALHLFARDGSDRGEVARLAGFARYAAQQYRGPEPLSPRSLHAVSHGSVYVAETLGPRIEVRTPAGALEREITWNANEAPSPSATLRLVVDSAVARARSDQAAATRQRLEAAPMPDRISVFWQFHVDDEGFIWIRSFEPHLHAAALGGLSQPGGGPGGRWLILSPEGAEVAAIQAPADLEVVRITANAVVGIARDSLGVESVRVHRLERN